MKMGLNFNPLRNEIFKCRLLENLNTNFEVSHVKIGIKLHKLWNLEVQFW